MGKHLIQISRWSSRSLFLAYSRMMTLIFALFCAASGQLPKNTSTKQTNAAPTIFKGTAYQASDSTTLGGIKLFLRTCLQPLYGMIPDYGIAYPEYGVIAPVYGMPTIPYQPIKTDSMVTDANGKFEVALSGSGTSDFYLTSEVITEPSGKSTYSTGCIFIKEGTDSTYSLYLNKSTTAVENAATTSKKPSVLTVYHGNELQIKIPGWHGTSGLASIVNSRGQEATTLSATTDGIFHWDTRSVAKGVYFFRFRDNQTRLTVRIMVK